MLAPFVFTSTTGQNGFSPVPCIALEAAALFKLHPRRRRRGVKVSYARARAHHLDGL